MEATCKRVEIGEERATVRWEGEVGDTGAWLGVEWDREGRGSAGAVSLSWLGGGGASMTACTRE